MADLIAALRVLATQYATDPVRLEELATICVARHLDRMADTDQPRAPAQTLLIARSILTQLAQTATNVVSDDIFQREATHGPTRRRRKAKRAAPSADDDDAAAERESAPPAKRAKLLDDALQTVATSNAFDYHLINDIAYYIGAMLDATSLGAWAQVANLRRGDTQQLLRADLRRPFARTESLDWEKAESDQNSGLKLAARRLETLCRVCNDLDLVNMTAELMSGDADRSWLSDTLDEDVWITLLNVWMTNNGQIPAGIDLERRMRSPFPVPTETFHRYVRLLFFKRARVGVPIAPVDEAGPMAALVDPADAELLMTLTNSIENDADAPVISTNPNNAMHFALDASDPANQFDPVTGLFQNYAAYTFIEPADAARFARADARIWALLRLILRYVPDADRINFDRAVPSNQSIPKPLHDFEALLALACRAARNNEMAQEIVAFVRSCESQAMKEFRAAFRHLDGVIRRYMYAINQYLFRIGALEWQIRPGWTLADMPKWIEAMRTESTFGSPGEFRAPHKAVGVERVAKRFLFGYDASPVVFGSTADIALFLTRALSPDKLALLKDKLAHAGDIPLEYIDAADSRRNALYKKRLDLRGTPTYVVYDTRDTSSWPAALNDGALRADEIEAAVAAITQSGYNRRVAAQGVAALLSYWIPHKLSDLRHANLRSGNGPSTLEQRLTEAFSPLHSDTRSILFEIIITSLYAVFDVTPYE